MKFIKFQPPQLKPITKVESLTESDSEYVKTYGRFWDEWELQNNAAKKDSKSFRQFMDSRGCWRCWNAFNRSTEPYDEHTYKHFKKVIDKWQDPKTRRSDRYYCGKHTSSGEVIIAEAWDTEDLLEGHLAFAFEIDKDTMTNVWIPTKYEVGSFREQWCDNGYTDTPVDVFREFEYLSYKFFKLENTNHEEAWLTLWEQQERLNEVKNSLDPAIQILEAYGVKNLPDRKDVEKTPYPILAWYKLVKADEVDLRPPNNNRGTETEKGIRKNNKTGSEKKLKELEEELEKLYSNKNEVLLDGKPLIKGEDYKAGAEILFGLKSSIIKHFYHRIKEAEREATLRKDTWLGGFPAKNASDSPVHYSINLDTAVEYADYPEWITCNDPKCPENLNMKQPT